MYGAKIGSLDTGLSNEINLGNITYCYKKERE